MKKTILYRLTFVGLLFVTFIFQEIQARAHLIVPPLNSKVVLAQMRPDLVMSSTFGKKPFAVGSFSDQAFLNVPLKKQQPTKKIKVLIFTSYGGAGHMIATQAMTENLEDFCDVKSAMAIDDVLGSLDYLKWITFGKLSGERLYNGLLANGWIRSTNFFAGVVGSNMTLMQIKKMEKIFTDYLLQEKPDVVISVIPFINLAVNNVTAKLGIPLLVVSTDNDIANWLCGVRRTPYKDHFKLTVGYDLEETKGKALCRKIPEQNIYVSGFPLKNVFYEPKDVPAIKKHWNIPENKFVIMISLGGNGSMATFKYVKNIVKKGHNAHILACVGRNEALAKKLEGLCITAPTTLSIIKFTPYIANLMAVSDVLITKPGPGIINEALYSNLPMIIDCTSNCLYWEKAGIKFVLNNGFGKKVSYFRDLNWMIKKFINNKPFYNGIKKRLTDYKKPVFKDFLRAKIKELYDLKPITKIENIQEHYQQLLEPAVVVPFLNKRMPVFGKKLDEEALLLQ